MRPGQWHALGHEAHGTHIQAGMNRDGIMGGRYDDSGDIRRDLLEPGQAIKPALALQIQIEQADGKVRMRCGESDGLAKRGGLKYLGIALEGLQQQTESSAKQRVVIDHQDLRMPSLDPLRERRKACSYALFASVMSAVRADG